MGPKEYAFWMVPTLKLRMMGSAVVPAMPPTVLMADTIPLLRLRYTVEVESMWIDSCLTLPKIPPTA